jgi:DNA-directed RNA polymerase specialized sigma24 family protein
MGKYSSQSEWDVMAKSTSLGRGAIAAVVLGSALSAMSATASVRHEILQDLNRYCATCWRNARVPTDHWSDCTQEVFVRLLERIPPDDWHRILEEDTEERRELVRAIDTVKKRSQRSKRFAELAVEVADPRGQDDAHLAERREVLRSAVAAVLTNRQQRIVERLAEGWTIAEIAQVENTTTERISDEKYKAVRKLRIHLGLES